MTWSYVYSVVDVVSTVLSVPLAVGGFWIAIAQIRKTRRAAESALDTAAKARADARRAGILVLIPQLQRIEDHIERAVDTQSADLLTAWASTWRWQASQLNHYLLRDRLTNSTPLPQLLQASVLEAATVKRSLGNGNPTAWARTRKRLGESVAAVTNELGGLAVHYTELPDDGNSS